MEEIGEGINSVDSQKLQRFQIEEIEQAIENGQHSKLVEILIRKDINLRSSCGDGKVIDKILTEAVNGHEVIKQENLVLFFNNFFQNSF